MSVQAFPESHMAKRVEEEPSLDGVSTNGDSLKHSLT